MEKILKILQELTELLICLGLLLFGKQCIFADINAQISMYVVYSTVV